MSDNTNIEKNKNSKKFDIITILDNSKRARIFFLIALGISGLVIRLYFFPVDVPLFGDSQGYFWYAIDTSILNQFPTGHNVTNNGWPIFLTVFFSVFICCVALPIAAQCSDYCYCAAVYSWARTSSSAVMGIKPQSQIFTAWFSWFLYCATVGIFSFKYRPLQNILANFA